MTFPQAANRYRGEILSYLIRLLGNVPEAEDVCQESFLRAGRAWGGLREGSNVRAWLYRIATNRARTTARSRRKHRHDTLDDEALPGSAVSAERREDQQRVVRAVRKLPQRQREALVLREFHGMSYAEIATTVGGSEATARANVYQALRRLRHALDESATKGESR